MTTKYYLVTDVRSECHILSVYEEPISNITEESDGVFADVFSIYDSDDIVESPAEYSGKKIAKVVFVGTSITPAKWKEEQGCGLEEIEESKWLELVNTSKLYKLNKSIIKEERNNQLLHSVVTLSNGVKLDANDIGLNRITAIMVHGLFQIILQLSQRNDDIKAALDKVKQLEVPFKDADNNFQNLNVVELAEAQKLILDNFSKLFQEYQ